ncbi:MAG: GNAT family N-acetyltransferase [Bacteroidetes bacterium]|nr:GNAT family N-acetyltransferase [Bacteroidota bacterium]
MKKIIKLYDKSKIEKTLRRNICLNIYGIGDLDDFFFINTEWYAVSQGDEILETAYLYRGTDLPVLLAMCGEENGNMKILLKGIMNEFPEKIYAHLTEGLEKVFDYDYKRTDHGKHFKMCLYKNDFTEENSGENIRRLLPGDIGIIKEFYNTAYPDNWFDGRMLGTGKYFGMFSENGLIGVAGIHVYSAEYKTAALGNITTHPLHRGKSICRKVTSALCSDLFKTTDIIGLNVLCENKAAIECYQRLGFRICGEYSEYSFTKKLSV